MEGFEKWLNNKSKGRSKTPVSDDSVLEEGVRVCGDKKGDVVSVVMTMTRVVETETGSLEVEKKDVVDVDNCGEVSRTRENGVAVGGEHGGEGENENNGVEQSVASGSWLMRNGINIDSTKAGGEVKERGNGGDSDSEVNEEEDEEEEDEDMDIEEYEYSVGDYIWGKIKSHPWWPGRIYDPSDASGNAVKLKKKDCYLVAYAGDGTFAWCNHSQLKPFEENFVTLSKQSHSKAFLNAVDAALEEIGQVEESVMTCSCLLKDPRIKFTRPIAKNWGVKEGVFVPDGGKDKLAKFDPAEILAELKSLSQVVYEESVLELTLLKSKLSAFYRAKGGYELPKYNEPQRIIGLEDKSKTGVNNNDDIDQHLNVPIEGQIEGDWLSSPGQPECDNNRSSLQKDPIIAEDKLYQRRKQKSIAEIINEDSDVKYKSQGKDTAQGGKELSKPVSNSRGRKKKGGDQGDTRLDSSPGKRKNPRLATVSTGTEKDENDGGKTKDNSVEEISEMDYSPRERKKSKYLSPPFTNPQSREKTSSNAKKESEVGFLSSTSSPRVGERMSKVAGHIFSSPPILKCSAEMIHSPISRTPKSVQKIVVDPSIAKTSATVVLSEIRYAAIGHLFSKEPESLDMIMIFFSLFRSTIFCNGHYYDAYKELNLSRKRKSPERGSDPSTADENLFKTKPRKTKSTAELNKVSKVDLDNTPHGEASESSPVEYIKQKLELMQSMVDKSDGKLSQEMKTSLGRELIGLLKRVRSFQ